MNTFCTIITADYLFYALATNNALLQFRKDFKFHILIADKPSNIGSAEQYPSNIKINYVPEVCSRGIGKSIHQKYLQKENNMDHFRWSMKSVFMSYLMEEKDYKKVIFIDPDVFFFNDFQFLFDELNENNIILTPHWRSIQPKLDEKNFENQFTNGLFNAGFIGANKNGLAALQQWAEWCLYKCVNAPKKGLYDDQSYLNLFPIYFDKVKIIKHRGCNVADWNRLECKRVLKDGEVLINGQYKIIFIHFAKNTIMGSLYFEDQFLKPYTEIWFSKLKKYNPMFNPEIIYKYVPRKVSLRTRVIILFKSILPLSFQRKIRSTIKSINN